MTSEIAEKERRARQVLEEQQLGALALSTVAGFAWITCGGDNHVGLASEGGVASAVVTPNGKYIVCDNIEAARIMNEEVADQGFQLESYDWWEDKRDEILQRLAGGKPMGADMPMPGAKNVGAAVAAQRRSLAPEEIDRYRLVGAEVGHCIGVASRAVKPGMTEHEIAALMDEMMISRGMQLTVTLVAADERIGLYRHPIPTQKKVEKYVMLVIGARKWGLIVSATRLVHFGRLSDELRRKHDAVAEVDATYICYTRAGAGVGEIFSKAQEAYARTGFGEEWKKHHQGGPTGYLARDYRANPATADAVLPDQAFAWNPSITGTKSEDTIVATRAGTEVISPTDDWPMIDVVVDGQTIARPDILEL